MSDPKGESSVSAVGQGQLTVPVEVTSKVVKPRGVSPARLAPELNLKAQTQIGRVQLLTESAEQLPADHTGTSLEELRELDNQVEETHRLFQSEHSYLESVWPAAHLEHEYFRDSVHLKCCRAYSTFKMAAARLRKDLMPVATERTAHMDDPREVARLPGIKLPSFSGDYAAWPAFADMFTSLIRDRASLTDVERLHYLRGCLTGTPAQLITSFPLTGTSFQPSWEVLVSRYENKRLNIQSHLDAMFKIAPMPTKNAKALNQLITTVTEAYTALESLGVGENLGDCILVHHITRNLDRSTKEAWETSLGTLQTYPTYKQLVEFLTARARALERVEYTSSGQPSAPQKRTAHSAVSAKQGSAQQSGSAQSSASSKKDDTRYACDCCKGDHFIVTCSQFRGLDPRARRQLAMEKRLCFNCLGRHSARDCRTNQGCKECKERHHTMLHGSRTVQQRDAPKDSTTAKTQ